MPNLETLTQSGMFTVDSDRQFSPSMFSLGEEQVAEDFAYVINDGRVPVEDFFLNFCSYVEDKELWGLEEVSDDDFRALLPDWEHIVTGMASSLSEYPLYDFVDTLIEPYFGLKTTGGNGGLFGSHPSYDSAQDYNPFIHNFVLAVNIFSRSKKRSTHSRGRSIAEKLLDEISLGELIINVQEEGNKAKDLALKIYTSLGYDRSIAKFVTEYRDLFHIENLGNILPLLDDLRDPNDFVAALEKVVYEPEQDLKPCGEQLCETLEAINSESSGELLQRIKEDFGSVESITKYFRKKEIQRERAEEKQDSQEPGEPGEPDEMSYEKAERRFAKGLRKKGKDPLQFLMAVRVYDNSWLEVLRTLDSRRTVDLLIQKYLTKRRYRTQALSYLFYIARIEKISESGKLAKRAFLEYSANHPELLKGTESSIACFLKEVVDFEDAKNLIRIYNYWSAEGMEYTSSWPDILAATGNNIVIDPIISFMRSDDINTIYSGAGAINILNNVEGYTAYVNYMRELERQGNKERLGRCINCLSDIDNLEDLEARAKTGVFEIIADVCHEEISRVDNYAKVLARLGNLEALELFYEYLRSKRIDTPGDDWASKFATQHYAQLGAVKTLEALPSLVGKARKIGIHIPSDVFDIVAGFVTYGSKLISWHDHALRALDPVKYIRFAQGYMPQNYGCEGIEPLYAACKKTHDGMKPKGYKAPQLPLAA